MSRKQKNKILELIILFFLSVPLMDLNSQRFPSESSGIDALFTSGLKAGGEMGDDDHLQVIYFLVPSDSVHEFYIRIIDSGLSAENDLISGIPDSEFEYRLFGRKYVYQPINQPHFAEDTAMIRLSSFHSNFQNEILLGPIKPEEGELKAEMKAYLFRLEVEGISGDDGNYYSLIAETGTEVDNKEAGISFLFNQLCFRLPDHEIDFQIGIPAQASGISIRIFDMENEGSIRVFSNRRKGQLIKPPPDNGYRMALLNVFSEEKNSRIRLQIRGNDEPDNNAGIDWLIEDHNGKDISMPFSWELTQEFKPVKRRFP